MATKTDSPQVVALLSEVEKTYGRPVKTPADFILLADRIETKTREHISDSTIKRLWKHALAYETVSDRTLNVIAQYTGYDHFQDFLDYLAKQGRMESELITGKECIKASDLKKGDIVRIAWQPDRECCLRYLGDRQFIVESAQNSKISPQDTFFCSTFIKGRPLYVDDLNHNGEIYERYNIGTEHGLSRVLIEK